jgi:hypothetical protein
VGTVASEQQNSIIPWVVSPQSDTKDVLIEAILFAASTQSFLDDLTKEQRAVLDAFVAHIDKTYDLKSTWEQTP